MNVDLTVINGLEGTCPNSDAMYAWIVYNLAHNISPVLEDEVSELKNVVRAYVQRGYQLCVGNVTPAKIFVALSHIVSV